MPDLPELFSTSPADNDTPLPLIVAKRWNFPLAHVRTDEGLFYAIQDWIRGLTGINDVRRVLPKFESSEFGRQVSLRKGQFPYTASNRKTYQIEHTTDKGLYLIAQYLRVTKARPVLDEIKKFLAASGAFVDE